MQRIARERTGETNNGLGETSPGPTEAKRARTNAGGNTRRDECPRIIAGGSAVCKRPLENRAGGNLGSAAVASGGAFGQWLECYRRACHSAWRDWPVTWRERPERMGRSGLDVARCREFVRRVSSYPRPNHCRADRSAWRIAGGVQRVVSVFDDEPDPQPLGDGGDVANCRSARSELVGT